MMKYIKDNKFGKGKYVAVLTLVLLIGVSGCSNETVSEGVVKLDSGISSSMKIINKSPSLTGSTRIDKDKPKVADSSETGVMDVVEDTYVSDVYGFTGDLLTQFNTFEKLNRDAIQDLDKLKDSSWKESVDSEMQDINLTIERLEDLTPTPKGKYNDSNSLLKESIENYKYIMDNYSSAVDSKDINTILELKDRLDLATSLITQSLEQFENEIGTANN